MYSSIKLSGLHLQTSALYINNRWCFRVGFSFIYITPATIIIITIINVINIINNIININIIRFGIYLVCCRPHLFHRY